MLGFALGLLQMLLYAKYRNSKPKNVAKEEPLKNIVVVNPLGTSEVYPVQVIDKEKEEGVEGPREDEKDVEAKKRPA